MFPRGRGVETLAEYKPAAYAFLAEQVALRHAQRFQNCVSQHIAIFALKTAGALCQREGKKLEGSVGEDGRCIG